MAVFGFVTIMRIFIFSCLCFILKINGIFSSDITCAKMKYSYNAKGLDNSEVPLRAIPDDHLKICHRQGRSCCTPNMEVKFTEQIQTEMKKQVQQSIALVLKTMSTRTIKFDKYFQDLLINAKRDFHQLFTKTYGVMYQRNSHVALKLFEDLTSYYTTGKPDLIHLLDEFFVRLYQTMFQVTHQHYKFSQQYLDCIKGMMYELKPFGNVPRRLSAEIKRAFVASRIFVQSLAVGSNVIKNMMQIDFSTDCTKALMKMSYCSHCGGHLDSKPCNGYCLNVMKGCLAYHGQLSPEWNNYVAKLMKLSVRLEDSFNIEDVVHPINIEISDAIMNFQENTLKITEKLFEKCGKPNIGKRSVQQSDLHKRNAHKGELIHEKYKFPSGGGGGTGSTADKASGITLKNHIIEIRKKMKVLKSYWKNMPYQMCNDNNVAAKSNVKDHCWNGIKLARYDAPLVGDGFYNQTKNPEVATNLNKQNTIVNDLIVSLRLSGMRMAKAHDGVYVNWTGSELSGIENLELDDLIGSAEMVDLDEEDVDGSGGGGSGVGGPDMTGDDDDQDPVSTFTVTIKPMSEKPSPLTTTPPAIVTTTTTSKPTTAKTTPESTTATTTTESTTTTEPDEDIAFSSGSGSGEAPDDEDSPVASFPVNHRQPDYKFEVTTPGEEHRITVSPSSAVIPDENTDLYFPVMTGEPRRPNKRPPITRTTTLPPPNKKNKNNSGATKKPKSGSGRPHSSPLVKVIMCILFTIFKRLN